MNILIRNHNSDIGREKTPPAIPERIAAITIGFRDLTKSVQYERNHGFTPGSGDKLFPTTYGKWVTGHEVVSEKHTKTRIAKAAPVVAESIDKLDVTAKPSGQIDLNKKDFDPHLFDAMANEKEFEAKTDGAKLGAQDIPDTNAIAPDSEQGAKIYRIADARKRVEEARPQEGADNAIIPKAA